MKSNEQIELENYLLAIPARKGERPSTMGPAPHTQTNQFPETYKYADALHEYIMSFEGVLNGKSHIGDGGYRAYFIKDEKNRIGFTKEFLVDNEFAHIHRHGSKSLHIVLPVELGREMERKGWSENHPLSIANRIPETNFMLFGARNLEELKISKAFLRVSYLFATKQWM